MLKKTNAGGSRGARNTSAIRLFRVLEVSESGLVVRFLNDRGADAEAAFLEATPNFVAQKDKSPNFVAKSANGKRDPRFYKALMRPTTNPDHLIKSGDVSTADVVSAKLYLGDQTYDHPSLGKIAKGSIAGGFNIFARNTSIKRDPLDDAMTKTVPADRIVIGRGRLVTDATPERTTHYFEVVSELGAPESMDALFSSMRDLASSKLVDSRGLLYIRLNNGTDEFTASVKPESAAETEVTIKDIQDLGLSPENVAVFHSHGRIYVNDDFMVAQGASRSKYERFLADIERGLGVNLESTPVTTNTKENTYQGKTTRAPMASYVLPVALSRTMYEKEGSYVPGALRSIVPLSGEVIPSNHLYKTPAQREAAIAKAAEAAATPQDGPAQDQQDAPAAETPAAPAPRTGGEELDFGFEK